MSKQTCAACGGPAPGDFVLTYNGVGHPICERHATTPDSDLRRLIELREENDHLKSLLCEALELLTAPRGGMGGGLVVPEFMRRVSEVLRASKKAEQRQRQQREQLCDELDAELEKLRQPTSVLEQVLGPLDDEDEVEDDAEDVHLSADHFAGLAGNEGEDDDGDGDE